MERAKEISVISPIVPKSIGVEVCEMETDSDGTKPLIDVTITDLEGNEIQLALWPREADQLRGLLEASLKGMDTSYDMNAFIKDAYNKEKQ